MFNLMTWTSMLIKLDYAIGLRAFGLVLYGALPANLAILGILKVELTSVRNFSPAYLIAAAILPFSVVCLLVRSRLRVWYGSPKFLLARSSVLTLGILICASVICGLAGIIRGEYVLNVSSLLKPSEWQAIAESLLMAVVSLVLASTLFSSVLVKGDSLPGLPSGEFAETMREYARFNKSLTDSGIWRQCPDHELEVLWNDAESLILKAKGTSNVGGYLNRISMVRLENDLNGMEKALNELLRAQDPGARHRLWEQLFGPADRLSQPDRIRRQHKSSFVASIANLKIGLY
jgi:hypothetical protein